MGCHEGSPGRIVHSLQDIGNVHDDMSAQMKFVSAGIHDNLLRMPAVYVSAYPTVPDSVTSQIADWFCLMTKHIAAGVTCCREHPPVAVMAFSLRQMDVAEA